MFLPFQVFFAFGVGLGLIVNGVKLLRSPGTERRQYWRAWLMVALGLLALAWFPLLFMDEQSRTRTDSEGTYIVKHGEEEKR